MTGYGCTQGFAFAKLGRRRKSLPKRTGIESERKACPDTLMAFDSQLVMAADRNPSATQLLAGGSASGDRGFDAEFGTVKRASGEAFNTDNGSGFAKIANEAEEMLMIPPHGPVGTEVASTQTLYAIRPSQAPVAWPEIPDRVIVESATPLSKHLAGGG